MSLAWGQSPIDLPTEQPLELKFLEAQAGVLEVMDDRGSLELSSCVPEARIRSGLGWTSGALLISTVALLVLNAHAFGNWADQNPDAFGAELAHKWYETAERWGLNTLVDAVERAANFMRKAGWH